DQDLVGIDINTFDLDGILNGAGISLTNYTTTLEYWSDLTLTGTTTKIDMGTSMYCGDLADAGRESVIDYGFTLYDNGLDPICYGLEAETYNYYWNIGRTMKIPRFKKLNDLVVSLKDE